LKVFKDKDHPGRIVEIPFPCDLGLHWLRYVDHYLFPSGDRIVDGETILESLGFTHLPTFQSEQPVDHVPTAVAIERFDKGSRLEVDVEHKKRTPGSHRTPAPRTLV